MFETIIGESGGYHFISHDGTENGARNIIGYIYVSGIYLAFFISDIE